MNPTSSELRALLDRVAPGVKLTADGRLPVIAGATEVPSGVGQPLGGATATGTTITVDTYVNPPTKIPALIRSLVAEDEGYFIEKVFGTLGSPIQGGAVIVEETFPEDFFLPADGQPAPRAPGAEAPRLTSERHEPKVKRPESWAGSIEVTDEAKLRNNVIAVRNQFTKAANTFSQIVQLRGVEVLLDFIASSGRVLESKVNWHEPHTSGVTFTDPLKLPAFDVSRVLKQFRDDKVGVRPDTVLMNTEELLFLEAFYPGVGGLLSLEQMFSRQGVNQVIGTPLIPVGKVIYAKAGAPGVIGWELPMSQEFVREGNRKTDLYVLECRPIFAAFDASAVLMLEGTDS